jgi:hypothetical protein
VPTEAVSEIFSIARPAVLVSIVTPGITGDSVYLYVGVPELMVKVSLREIFIVFEIDVEVPVILRAPLITAKTAEDVS